MIFFFYFWKSVRTEYSYEWEFQEKRLIQMMNEWISYEKILIFPFCIQQLFMILIKVADISNEARPLDIAEPWLECLMQVGSFK